MARPIAPKPKLDAKGTKKFCIMVENDLKKPMGPIATPKIDKPIKTVMADARSRNLSSQMRSTPIEHKQGD